jgi:hypothetical protein
MPVPSSTSGFVQPDSQALELCHDRDIELPAYVLEILESYWPARHRYDASSPDLTSDDLAVVKHAPHLLRRALSTFVCETSRREPWFWLPQLQALLTQVSDPDNGSVVVLAQPPWVLLWSSNSWGDFIW